MKIDRNSYGTVLLVYLVCAVLICLLFLFVKVKWLDWILTAGLLWVSGWQTSFHMVPKRTTPAGDGLVTAVSDGKIVIIEKNYESEFLKQECIQVSIYMDFWDFHANFWPVGGEIDYTCYHEGKHLLAFKPKASLENEHACTCIRTPEGKSVFFKQIAGGWARRIVCYSKPGMEVRRGEQCGIIKFGSRIDIFLPLDAEIRVKLGDEVRACETIIAQL